MPSGCTRPRPKACSWSGLVSKASELYGFRVWGSTVQPKAQIDQPSWETWVFSFRQRASNTNSTKSLVAWQSLEAPQGDPTPFGLRVSLMGVRTRCGHDLLCYSCVTSHPSHDLPRSCYFEKKIQIVQPTARTRPKHYSKAPSLVPDIESFRCRRKAFAWCKPTHLSRW